MSRPLYAVAEARSNIALCKYWGKRDEQLNLPAVGSLSLTLDQFATRTSVHFDPRLDRDTLTLNGAVATEKELLPVCLLLDLVRATAGLRARAEVVSRNNFPTASGLASSASAFAALALSASAAAGLELDGPALSRLARRGSGSAARSVFGGFVQMHRGQRDDGEDAFAEPIPAALDVRLVVAVTTEGPKATLSRDGMRRTAATSPLYPGWLASAPADLEAARRAIATADLAALGAITERSCLTMHASALAARPAVVYFRGVTLEGLEAIVALRHAGIPAYFTCDAGPHIKALTDATHAAAVAERLGALPGVVRTHVCAPGAGAQLVEGGGEP